MHHCTKLYDISLPLHTAYLPIPFADESRLDLSPRSHLSAGIGDSGLSFEIDEIAGADSGPGIAFFTRPHQMRLDERSEPFPVALTSVSFVL